MAATTTTVPRTVTQIQIRIDIGLGLESWSTNKSSRMESGMELLPRVSRWALISRSWVSMRWVPCKRLTELGRVAGLNSHSKCSASGEILRVKSEKMVWFTKEVEQPWGMEMRLVPLILRG